LSPKLTFQIVLESSFTEWVSQANKQTNKQTNQSINQYSTNSNQEDNKAKTGN